MKKIYERPIMSVTSFEAEDITTSGLNLGGIQTTIDTYTITSENL